MTPALTAAAERLITLPGFRWMPGMVDANGNRVTGNGEEAVTDGYSQTLTLVSAYNSRSVKLSLPDLTDPATLGCVLAMVREAYGDPSMFAKAVCGGWMLAHDCGVWMDSTGNYYPMFLTEAECLVNALAAAGAK